MYKKEITLEVAKKLQGKYGQMVKVLDLTKEIAHSLQEGDVVNTSILLELRNQEMMQCDTYDDKIEEILEQLDDEEYTYQIRQWMQAKNQQEVDETGILIYNIALKIKNVVLQAIEIDKISSKKIGGKDSYYS